MSRCNPAARWGPGTTCEKPVSTANARELEAQLDAMRAARESVDKMWTAAPAPAPAVKPSPKQEANSKYITFRSSN